MDYNNDERKENEMLRNTKNYPSKPENVIFARNLSHYMRIYRVTQLALSQKLGIASATVSQYCNGIKMPRMEKIDRICQLFNCSRSDLLEERRSDPDPEEQHLLSDFRLLDPSEKKIVRNLTGELAAKYKKGTAAVG